MNTFIYALIDPETSRIRYIGKANNPKHRFWIHIHGAKISSDFGKNHKNDWIRKLIKNDSKPNLEILDEVPKDNWQHWEKWWIATEKEKAKNFGYDLTNDTDGGEGGSGRIQSEEERNKRSIILKKTYENPDIRKKCASMKGKHHNETTKDKLRKIHLGKNKPKFSLERKLKHSEIMKNRKKFSDKWKQNLKLASLKRYRIKEIDIIKLGIKPGPKIKELLKLVEDAYLENPNLTRDEALKIVKDNL